MVSLQKNIKTDWERWVFALSAVLSMAALVCFALCREGRSEGDEASKTMKDMPHVLSGKALAYMRPGRLSADAMTRNPFMPVLGAPKRGRSAVRQAWSPPAMPDDSAPERPEPRPDPDAGGLETVEIDVPALPKQARATVSFAFQQCNASGKTVAIVACSKEGGARPENRIVGIGDMLFGMKVSSISSKELVLEDKAGRTTAIPLRGERSFAYEVDK